LEKKNQRNVFIEFAAGLGIPPLLADSWYSVNPDFFYSSKVDLHIFGTVEIHFL
jgi:hypothetical protein